ncbi:MAG TPA: Lrp/AsnC family transcriptional regulator [Pseudonocardiaceae bacterium]|nr:Lrp/AsnC family transcriptional regulator [Pseudonocardiaceae bacterium]
MNDAAPLIRLDEIDRRIVAALQADPRGSWAQLAGVVGVSETTVLRRTQRLRETGALIVVAAPDPLRCGFGQPVLLQFRTVPGEAAKLGHYLAQRQDVRYVSLLTGRMDVMCELIAPDRRYLSQVLTLDLPETGSVVSSTTDIVLRRFKTKDQWSHELLAPQAHPVAEPAPPAPTTERVSPLDDMDMRLLAALRQDGRRSYADLSHDLGLSETAVARRSTALAGSNRLYFVAMVEPGALGFEFEVMVHLRVEPSAIESIAISLAARAEVRYMSATTGHSDLTCDAIFRDTEALYHFVTHTVGSMRGVRDIEVDVVLESLKREYRYPLFQPEPSTRGPRHVAKGDRATGPQPAAKAAKTAPRQASPNRTRARPAPTQ